MVARVLVGQLPAANVSCAKQFVRCSSRLPLWVRAFAPLLQGRYFVVSRGPILVSPLSIRAFFTGYGLAVLRSEAFYIGVPSLALVACGALLGLLT